ELLPVLAAIGGFKNATAGSVPRTVFPWAFARLPQGGVSDVGVAGIDLHVGAADVFVAIENFGESLATISRTKNAALLVGTIGMAGDGNQNLAGIARIDGDLRDLLAVAQAEMRPGAPGVGGFIDSVAHRKIGPVQAFAAADINDVGIGGRYRYRADRTSGLIVKDRIPSAAIVIGLPHAA